MEKFEYRAVIKYLIKKNFTPKQIKQELDLVYGDSAPCFKTVLNWADRFKAGQESIEDDPNIGRPNTALTEENVELVKNIVLSDRRLKVKEIIAQSSLSCGTVFTILHDHLNMKKISARFVPKLLSAIQQKERKETCELFLQLHGANKNDFLERIVTGDETMVLYHDPTTKKESMEWRRPDENRPIKAKVAGSKKKIMASIFWDCEGILLIDSKEPNTTVNAAYYASLLHKLRDAIKEKRRGKLSKNILLLHDNAPVHKAQVAQAAIRECGFTEIDPPPYSPDLAPSDFFLFKNLKKELRGKKFQNDEDLKSAVIDHFENKDSNYFLTSMKALFARCEKCISVNGSYIEK